MNRIQYFIALAVVLSICVLFYMSLEKEVEFRPGIAEERPSPSNHVKKEQIHVTDTQVRLDVPYASWSTFVDTNSMDPVFDVGNHAIKITPSATSDIHLGDIISYRSEYKAGLLVIHRVVDIGTDEQGWYAIAKGDNNLDADPGKIRFDQVKFIVVSVIY